MTDDTGQDQEWRDGAPHRQNLAVQLAQQLPENRRAALDIIKRLPAAYDFYHDSAEPMISRAVSGPSTGEPKRAF